MLDHVFFQVTPAQFDSIVAWYTTTLAPLGYFKTADKGDSVGFGQKEGQAPFWIATHEKTVASGIHLAFKAKDHETVDKFFEEAIKAGGTDDGKPGLRTKFHPSYYAAYVLDPLG
jgi:hypothetical protein